jgi:hypothetical protein
MTAPPCFEQTKAQGYEAVVAKRSTSIYRWGERSPNRIKTKHWLEGEFVIGGCHRLGSTTGVCWSDPGRTVVDTPPVGEVLRDRQPDAALLASIAGERRRRADCRSRLLNADTALE